MAMLAPYPSQLHANELLIKYTGFVEQSKTPSIIVTPSGDKVNLVKLRSRLMGKGFQKGDTAALNLKTGTIRIFKGKSPVAIIKTERKFARIKLTENVALVSASKAFFTIDNPLSALDQDGGVVFTGSFNKAAYRSSRDMRFAQQDLDEDDSPNGIDNCVSVFNPRQTDTDGDSSGDACDNDDDNDELNDAGDNCPLIANQDQVNTDGDADGDACDADDDNDSVTDNDDNCQLIENVDQTDTDSDQNGDACDADDDNDGVADQDDVAPLDPLACRDIDMDSCDDCSVGVDGFGELPDHDISNDGSDQDGDFQCDIGDPDVDGDNSLNTVDNCPLVSNPDQADSNGNGTGDVCELTPSEEADFCIPIIAKNGKLALVCL